MGQQFNSKEANSYSLNQRLSYARPATDSLENSVKKQKLGSPRRERGLVPKTDCGFNSNEFVEISRNYDQYSVNELNSSNNMNVFNGKFDFLNQILF